MCNYIETTASWNTLDESTVSSDAISLRNLFFLLQPLANLYSGGVWIVKLDDRTITGVYRHPHPNQRLQTVQVRRTLRLYIIPSQQA